jgi:hypothetical protein
MREAQDVTAFDPGQAAGPSDEQKAQRAPAGGRDLDAIGELCRTSLPFLDQERRTFEGLHCSDELPVRCPRDQPFEVVRAPNRRSSLSARLAGDPVLEECLAGRHRMLAGEQGLSVKRVQQALLDLGLTVAWSWRCGWDLRPRYR